MVLLSPRTALLAAFALIALPTTASAVTVTFDDLGLVHGEVVDTDFAATQFITSITTTNIGGGPSLGIMFDTTETGTSDPDLEDPWSGGNLASTTVLNNILIIQENATGCGDDVCDDPDDEGSRPAGSFDILFTEDIFAFGFDLIDIDDTIGENGSIVFHDGVNTFTIDWDDFEFGGAFAVPGLVFGNNFINRIPEITPADVGLTAFDRIVINMGGSGGIDNLIVPEPATGVLVAFGSLGLVAIARRRS